MSDLDVTPAVEDVDGRQHLTPGSDVTYDGRAMRIVTFDHNEQGRFSVLLDTGEGLQRVPWMDFFATISAQAATDTPPQEPAVGGLQSPALAASSLR